MMVCFYAVRSPPNFHTACRVKQGRERTMSVHARVPWQSRERNRIIFNDN